MEHRHLDISPGEWGVAVVESIWERGSDPDILATSGEMARTTADQTGSSDPQAMMRKRGCVTFCGGSQTERNLLRSEEPVVGLSVCAVLSGIQHPAQNCQHGRFFAKDARLDLQLHIHALPVLAHQRHFLS